MQLPIEVHAEAEEPMRARSGSRRLALALEERGAVDFAELFVQNPMADERRNVARACYRLDDVRRAFSALLSRLPLQGALSVARFQRVLLGAVVQYHAARKTVSKASTHGRYKPDDSEQHLTLRD